MNTKSLSLEQMENLEGGSTYSNVCNGLMLGWGGVLTYGAAAAGVTAGVSLGIALVWGGLTWGLCSLE